MLLYIVHTYVTTIFLTFNSFYWMFNWRIGSEPMYSWSMTYFHLYISFDWPSTMCMCTLQANVKLAHCKFKSHTFSANFLAVSPFNKCLFSFHNRPSLGLDSVKACWMALYTDIFVWDTNHAITYNVPCCPLVPVHWHAFNGPLS